MTTNTPDIYDNDIFHSDDKYNANLNVNHLYRQFNQVNFPRSQYIQLDELSLSNNNILTVLTLNIRSIPTNLQSFTDNILCNMNTQSSIIGLTEIRLCPHLASLYQLPGFSMFTSCRNTQGGGTALYVPQSFRPTALKEFSKVDVFIECIGVEATIMNKKSLFLCIYRSPSANINMFIDALTDMFALAYEKKFHGIFVFGDFNLDLFKFNDIHVQEFCNLMYSYSLSPLTTKPTRVTDTTTTLIDHIWSSQADTNTGNFIINTEISDHYPVISQFSTTVSHKPIVFYKRIINDFTLNTFKEDLSKVNWNNVTQCSCPEESFNIFLHEFNTLYHKHFVVKKHCLNNKHIISPYITSALKKSITEKNRLARLANKWPITYRETYRRYRNNLTKTLRAAKNDYYKNKLRNKQGDPKAHWQIINNLLGRANNVHPTITLDPPCDNTANVFNEHFINIGNTQTDASDNYLRYLNQPPAFSMYMTPTNTNEVMNYLKELKSESPGFDEISPKVLKFTNNILTIPLTHIINLTIKQGIFPQHLKKAKVIPIFKSGNRCDINNYRPISVLPAFSKIFEKVIVARLVKYLEENQILSQYQHGFRANHSTETAILQFVNNIYKSLEDKLYVVGVFIDLSKAFDSINHNILIDKMQHIGIRGVPLQLFRSYLSNRSQSVSCNNVTSQFNSIFRGVPQGSVVGPILFLIYVNDIINASSKFKYTIYADDTNLLLTDKDITSLHSSIHTELKLINQWIKCNKLKLNVSKTNYILFQNRSIKNILPPLQLEGTTLNQVHHAKFLGVRIDENLNWKLHIDDISLRVSKVCGILYKIRHTLTTDALISIYYTLCYPHLTYCVPIWASTWPSFIKKLEVAQRKVIRCISFLGKFDSVSSQFSSMKLLNFHSIHTYFSLLLIYKMLKFRTNNIFQFVNSSHVTRSNNVNLICPQFRTTLFKNCILYLGPKIFNALPLNLKKIVTVDNFLSYKKQIKEYLLKTSL